MSFAAFFFRYYSFLLAIILLSAAPAAVRGFQDFATWPGFFSDLFCAVIIAVSAIHLSRKARAPLLLIWALVQLGSFMLLESMARLPSWQDFQFVGDGDFVANSLSEVSLTQVLYSSIFLSSAIIVSVLPKQSVFLNVFQSQRAWINISVLIVMLLVNAVAHRTSLKNVSSAENLYALYNPLHWLAADAWQLMSPDAQPIPAEYMLRQDLAATSLIPQPGKAKNVLLIALEGMTGLYLQQAREHFAINSEDPPVLMPKLSAFATQNNGMVVPDFVVHSHQTIRGLYSMLCSDMDKLSTGTPKAVELQNAPQRSARCLPTELSRHGYSTHFLQGAGLAFMGKDRIMPALGFNYVHGREWFKGKTRQHVQFGWGMDDKSFFEGSVKYVDQLVKESKKNSDQPWFLTLLTVGTHQPYAIPDNYEKKYKDRRDASVAYIDEGVTAFLQTLKKRGVLDNTLVIITSDESHGYDLADWVSAWGINVVFAPEKNALPAVNPDKYALSDVPLSIMDYLGLNMDKKMAGRSFFRAYNKEREMVSNTAGRLRWLKKGVRYECAPLGNCRTCKASSLIGWADCSMDAPAPFDEITRKADWLDASVTREALATNVLNFANGEKHNIKRAWKNAWMDNIIGAQYLDFPANSRTTVKMRWKAITTGKQGARLKILFKQYDAEAAEQPPELPLFFSNDVKEFTFSIDNVERRSNFSFHLLAEAPMVIEIQEFVVTTVVNDKAANIANRAVNP
jgi:hypothetical protein